MLCLKCGHKNAPGLPWCTNCLTPFPPSRKNPFLICPECHHENDLDETYCEVCHEPLRPGQTE
ncbi:MAG: zinc ribbon domain-containing protein [Nitrospiria bacterium]